VVEMQGLRCSHRVVVEGEGVFGRVLSVASPFCAP
jgi:hypothetical protein